MGSAICEGRSGQGVVCEQPELSRRRWKQPGLDGARRTGWGGVDGSWKELLAAVAPPPQDQEDLGNSGPIHVGKAWEHVWFRPPPGDRALLASPASEPGSSQGCKSLSCKILGCLGLSLPICELVTAVPLWQEGHGVEGGALSLAPREPWQL